MGSQGGQRMDSPPADAPCPAEMPPHFAVRSGRGQLGLSSIVHILALLSTGKKPRLSL